MYDNLAFKKIGTFHSRCKRVAQLPSLWGYCANPIENHYKLAVVSCFDLTVTLT